MSKYDLGIKAGLKPNLMPETKFGEQRTKQAMQVKTHNHRARISIANQTSRYLRTARQYIENVGKGEFPKSAGRLNHKNNHRLYFIHSFANQTRVCNSIVCPFCSNSTVWSFVNKCHVNMQCLPAHQ
jgi:hypothetical protein